MRGRWCKYCEDNFLNNADIKSIEEKGMCKYCFETDHFDPHAKDKVSEHLTKAENPHSYTENLIGEDKDWAPRAGYSRCYICETDEFRHKGEGLCERCYRRKRDSRRARLDHIKLRRKLYARKWRDRKKNDPEYKMKNIIRKHRNKNKVAYE